MRLVLICKWSGRRIRSGQSARAFVCGGMSLFFCNSPLDFAGLDRRDPSWVEACRRDPGACCLLFHRGGLMRDAEGAPAVVTAADAERLGLARDALVFLGVEKGRPWFAADAPMDESGVMVPEDFRRAAMAMDLPLAAIAGRARALLLWHGRRRYCSNCSTELAVADAGLKRVCPGCGMEHFPRVDPSVIMLPVSGERCVMGRQASWPEGLYATLAGFMEPGETIEEACAREVMEEIHRPVLTARYVASQPWPFPSSLMIGLIAEIEPGELRPDDDLEDARWFTREEARALRDGPVARFAPANFSISRQLLDFWLDGRL